MNHLLPRSFGRAVRSGPFLILLTAAAVHLSAADADQATAVPTPAEVAAPNPTPAGEVVKLDPFEVSVAPDNSYGAINSNSLTSFNEELNKLPVTADIFDQTFINDTGATSVEEMIESYSAGAAVASTSPSSAAGQTQPLDRPSGGASLSLRGGLEATAVLRDGFFPATTTGVSYTTNFDLQEVDVVEGPQSLLYGAGGGGGVLNYVTKQAKFDAPPGGELAFQLDQYGNKMANVDYDVGNKYAAVRVDMVNQTVGGRRENIGGPLLGAYVQLAVKPFANTTVRMEYEDTKWTRFVNNDTTLTAVSTANDARNGQYLHYLLATNQINAAANGAPSGAGVIDNGNLNWGNIDSLGGADLVEPTGDQYSTGKIDTVWTPWLSTEIAGGYLAFESLKGGNGAPSFDAPNVAANTTGAWAMAITPKTGTSMVNWGGGYTKNLRISALLTNELFGGAGHSQTVIGADDTSTTNRNNVGEAYVKADSDFNPIRTGSAVNNGLTLIPSIYWSVANGPVKYPVWGSVIPKDITYNGQNYVLMVTNPSFGNLMSPSNPLGLTGTGFGSYRPNWNMDKGVYIANSTDWMDGRLTTLLGARAESVYNFGLSDNGANLAQPSIVTTDQTTNAINFSAGVNYRLLPWLRPYADISSTVNPPSSAELDPYGNPQLAEHALGEEVGVKLANPDQTISGSVAVYHTMAENEQAAFTITITDDINPVGLNGRLGSPSVYVNVNREADGVQATFTANPMPNWRIRLSAAYEHGINESSKGYAQLYNDQFHENSLGQVTYADGTVVYVSSTATKATLSSAGAAGAEPLTVTLMSTPSSVYYANPAAVTGAINSTSGAATILTGTSDSSTGGADPNIAAHGSILTGAVGLPISDIQINPGFTPPGVIPIFNAGDITEGYPQIAVNLESIYTFSNGLLKGLKLGGIYQGTWKYSAYYYYPMTVAGNPLDRNLEYWPTQCIFTGIIGYEWKVKGLRFSTQLNIGNIFNTYQIVLLPSYVNGWAGPDDATFNTQPRSYLWSTRIDF